MRSAKSLAQVMSELREMRADIGRGGSDGGPSARHSIPLDEIPANWGKTIDRINSRFTDGA
jgi:hypothetical protein